MPWRQIVYYFTLTASNVVGHDVVINRLEWCQNLISWVTMER